MTTTTASPASTAAPSTCPTHRPRRRAVGALAVAAAGATLVGTGAFSSWDVTATTSQGALTAGSAATTLLDANGGSFSTGVADLLPADWFHRYVDVRNDGSRASTFTGSVSAGGALAGHVAVEVTSCSVAWTSAGACPGTTTALGAGTPTATTPLTVAHGTIGTGTANTQHVRYRFTFSATAPREVQGRTGAVSATVSSTVVGGTDRTTG